MSRSSSQSSSGWCHGRSSSPAAASAGGLKTKCTAFLRSAGRSRVRGRTARCSPGRSSRRVVSSPQSSSPRSRSLLAAEAAVALDDVRPSSSRRSTCVPATRQSGSLTQNRPCCQARHRLFWAAARCEGWERSPSSGSKWCADVGADPHGVDQADARQDRRAAAEQVGLGPDRLADHPQAVPVGGDAGRPGSRPAALHRPGVDEVDLEVVDAEAAQACRRPRAGRPRPRDA